MSTETIKESNVIVAQGDVVTLFDGRTGQVAFIGPVDGKEEIQFGIILDKQFTGDTNGTINNTPYFNTTKNRGVFVTKSHIKKSKCMIFIVCNINITPNLNHSTSTSLHRTSY